ncbi:MAG: permease [Bacteroidetes bacterium CG12_big_fil_rev_8_21_14_0_65_60_17]|nr:MAG: permease [Bacteroidetes bacterium CG12_big_fil_rev_8_21_14_0_65_60_17]
MTKQFHKMMLRMLPGPFVAWLLVLLFLLVMQFLIKYLPQLVGKGLPVRVIFELISYNLAYMLVLAVPMAALISTLMAFGRLAETQAWTVIRGSGVSFVQLVWPVWIVGMLLSGGMWVFNTQIHPEANFRAFTLWKNIREAKPGFDLRAGVVYDGIDNYRMLVRHIPEENPNELYGVTLYDYSSGVRFRTDITAERGLLQTRNNGRMLLLTLFDGEVHRPRPGSGTVPDRYERMSFDRQLLRISLDDLDFRRTDPNQVNRNDRTMPSSAMIALVDSLHQTARAKKNELAEQVLRLGDGTLSDQAWQRSSQGRLLLRGRDVGNAFPAPIEPSEADSTGRALLLETARETARALRTSIDSGHRTVRFTSERADRYTVEIHKKYSMALSCFLFMILGAPLGLSIRRGGLGTSAVVALAIFMFHWVSLANGEKFADRGLMDPWLGMWLANIVTAILGLAMTLFVWLDLRAAVSPWARLGHWARHTLSLFTPMNHR